MIGRDPPPFLIHQQLIANEQENLDNPPHNQDIPNEPLRSTSRPLVESFLQQELETVVLDELYPHLWLFAKKDGGHIDALHQHIVKGRRIIVTEDPALHLVWHEDIIYVKPLPHCLLNFSFWEYYLLPGTGQVIDNLSGQQHQHVPVLNLPSAGALSSHRLWAQGFLRTYSYLIKHESDFILARDANLIPTSTSYRAFQIFIESFHGLVDFQVTKRYHYGQIRLTRLNLAVRLFRPSSLHRWLPWYYQKPHWHTTAYFHSFGPPLLFIFASFSLILSAMQVVFAALGPRTWEAFVAVSWRFSVAVVVLQALVGIAAVLGFVILILVQLHFGIRMRLKANRG